MKTMTIKLEPPSFTQENSNEAWTCGAMSAWSWAIREVDTDSAMKLMAMGIQQWGDAFRERVRVLDCEPEGWSEL